MATAKETSLTVGEHAELVKLEKEFSECTAKFVRAGEILKEIRDKKLFTDHADTFEEYCQKRWGFPRKRADQLIEAAKVTKNIAESVDAKFASPPQIESHAAALASVPPEKQAETWHKAVESAPKGTDGKPKVTASHVKAVAEKAAPKPPAKPETDKPPKSGTLKFDVRQFEKWIKHTEQLIRGIDAIHEKHPHRNNHNAALESAKQTKRTIQEWMKASR